MKKRSFRSTFVSVILVITVAISIVNLVCHTAILDSKARSVGKLCVYV